MKYKVPFVDPRKHYQNLKSEIDSAIYTTLSNGDLIMRSQLKDFENHLAEFVQTKYAVGVSSGYHALHLSLIAAGIGQGDEVITVAHTFISSIEEIVHLGAKAILIDVREDGLMDVSQIEKAITKKTKGIIPVHLNGHACQMDKIMELAQKYDLRVVEDAAQSLGAKFKGKRCASFGDAGIFSFYPAKLLGTAGDGGMVCTNDDALARKIRAFRDNGRVGSVEVIECFGWCTRLDNLHAAILNMKFNYFDRWVERRREIAKIYDKELTGVGDILIHPVSGEDYFDAYQNYVIRTKKRNELVQYLKDNGIEVLVSWSTPIHKQKALGLSHFKLPKTEQISAEVLSLPMYPELTDEEAQIVIGTIYDFFSK